VPRPAHAAAALAAACLTVAAAAQSSELRWVERDTPDALTDQGLQTLRLYAAAPDSAPRTRIHLVGTGPAGETSDTPTIARLAFTAPVWQHPLGGDTPIPHAELVDPTLAADTFVMLGEPDPDNTIGLVRKGSAGNPIDINWNSGIDVVWYRTADAAPIVDPEIFGDTRRWFAILQVTLPAGAEASGQLNLGWSTREGAVAQLLTVPPINNPEDLDDNNATDARDVLFLLDRWKTPDADLSGDAETNTTDLALLLRDLGIDRNALTTPEWRRQTRKFFLTQTLPLIRQRPARERGPLIQRYISVYRLSELPQDHNAETPAHNNTNNNSNPNADVNDDGTNSHLDVLAVLAAWDTPNADANNDATTNEHDLDITLAALNLDPNNASPGAWHARVHPFFRQHIAPNLRDLPPHQRPFAARRVFRADRN
jgi:hypothetical protein